MERETRLFHSNRSSSSPLYTVERGQKISEQIVIGTPGTVLDWCSKLKFIDPKKIRVFVLDEADVMIATQGHQDQSIRIQRYSLPLQASNPAIGAGSWLYGAGAALSFQWVAFSMGCRILIKNDVGFVG